MSRTKRKISSQAQVREDKEDLIKMIEALKSVKESRDINLALEELTLSFYITGSIKDFSQFEVLMILLISWKTL